MDGQRMHGRSQDYRGGTTAVTPSRAGRHRQCGGIGDTSSIGYWDITLPEGKCERFCSASRTIHRCISSDPRQIVKLTSKQAMDEDIPTSILLIRPVIVCAVHNLGLGVYSPAAMPALFLIYSGPDGPRSAHSCATGTVLLSFAA